MESPLTMPKNMRIPSLKERIWFYAHSFSKDESKDFTNTYNPPVYAIDIGNESSIYKPAFKKYINKLLYLSTPENITQKLIKYAPEDVYYSRNITKDPSLCRTCKKRSISCPACPNFKGQEMAFDIDPENIECKKCRPDKNNSIYSFCTHQLEDSKSKTIQLYEHLKKQKNYTDMRIVYSGRGYHIHILDRDTYTTPVKDRKKLADELKKKGYPIDTWVTSGRIDLIRLPGSLHGLVNRIVKEIPIKELDRFDPLYSKKVIPDYEKAPTH
ncbi:MAG: hypothetical protein DRN71_04970 [Candidatus Nanohalarchaeota archaeon]|nr:MAG: hypothetical protein DRN71_04970 [Candidatus Nanohaloarchaeota archaeon]